MIHPDTRIGFVSEEVGYGLFATCAIPLGTITWAQDPFDRVFKPDEMARLPAAGREQLERYSAREPNGDLLLFWDHARFMNHACAPTTLITGTGFSVAVRAIEEGEELTEDYAMLHLRPDEAFDCRCGHPDCRRRVGPTDVPTMVPSWRRRLATALDALPAVPQPLHSLLHPTQLPRFLKKG